MGKCGTGPFQRPTPCGVPQLIRGCFQHSGGGTGVHQPSLLWPQREGLCGGWEFLGRGQINYGNAVPTYRLNKAMCSVLSPCFWVEDYGTELIVPVSPAQSPPQSQRTPMSCLGSHTVGSRRLLGTQYRVHHLLIFDSDLPLNVSHL